MATIKYRVHSKKGNAQIYLQLSVGRGIYIQRKIGLSINVKDWSKSTGFPKQKTSAANTDLTTELRDLTTFVFKRLNDANTNGVEITGGWLVHQIDLNFKRITENGQSNSLTDYIQNIIDNADTKVLPGGKIGLSPNRVKGYVTFKGTIETYEKHLKKKLEFKDVDINFEDDFRNWLIKTKGYSLNYAGKNFDNLKAVCKDALHKGYKVNEHANHLRSFTENKDNREVITLSFDELEQIEKVKDLNNSLDNVRKWLLLGCEIGQRGGDLLSITEKNFRTNEIGNKYIDVTQQKTGKEVTIRVTNKIERILKTGFPYQISIQKFNNYLKDLCKLCEINDQIKGKVYDAKKKRKVAKLYSKHKLITSHCCRRSFATNYYKKMPTPILMGITAHSKESLFLTYIGVEEDKDANADLMLEFAEIMEQKRKEQKEKEKKNKKAKMKVIKKAN